MSSPQRPWVIGLQADTASAEDRDRFAQRMSRHAAGHPDWIVLSTCHRAELYGFGDAPPVDGDARVETGEAAVRHLFQVAAGLESAIVGEDEVLHQVREALARARASRAIDSRLGRMFETAISVGRSARAGRLSAASNLAQQAVAWLQERCELRGRPILIVGAGRMGSTLAHAARRAGSDVTIASRNQDRASRLARVHGGRGVDLAEGAEVALGSAAIAVALAGPWREFQPAAQRLPPIADISAPSAVSTAIRARLNGAFLGIDQLYSRDPVGPSSYIADAVRIVDAKAREFGTWLDRRD